MNLNPNDGLTDEARLERQMIIRARPEDDLIERLASESARANKLETAIRETLATYHSAIPRAAYVKLSNCLFL